MPLPKDTLEYWENVYRHSVPEDGSTITTNFFKRPALMRRILDYDFFGKNIVEIGCGIAIIGGILRILHGGGFTYLGTDPCEYACKISSDMFNVRVGTAAANSLPCEDKSVDYVFAFDVLEHIEVDVLDSVAIEMDRILNIESGKILVNNPLGPSRHDPRYDFDLSLEGLARFARMAGLRIERVENYFGAGPMEPIPYQFIAMGRVGP